MENNDKIVDELWMGLFNRKANKVGLTWSESVDCALSFGCIDGLRKKKKLDKED